MSWKMKQPLTTKEMMAIIEEDPDIQNTNDIDIIYIPPEVDEVTDEEDIDDNVIGEGSLHNEIAGTFEICATNLVDSDSDDDNTPLAEFANKRRKSESKKKFNANPNWQINGTPTYSSTPVSTNNTLLNIIKAEQEGKTPLEIFSLYFDTEFIGEIIRYTKSYADQKNRHLFDIDEIDLKRFIGICILSGYHTLPQSDMYWSKDEDKGVPIVRETMSRNKFRIIKQNIHLSNNSELDKTDKFAKLTPIFKLINQKFMQFGVFEHNLSIDEEMVPYFGRHSCKMFIRGKPVRFGFKLWCLCSYNGYLFKFIPYSGKSKCEKEGTMLYDSLGTRVVMELLSVIDNPQEYRIFFDNFFSSYALFSTLKEQGFFATGTIRENRIAKCPLQATKIIGKQARGTYEFVYDSVLQTLVVRWNDNSVVTVITNTCTVLPIVSAKRYNRKEHKEVMIPQPNLVAEYNKFMGGVDLHDNGIANYRIKIRGKKWWWPLFINMIDSTVVNSWKIYNIANETKISQIEFRSMLATSLMKYEAAQPSNKEPIFVNHGRLSRISLPIDVRFDNIGHFINKHETSARKKCRVCNNNTIYLCMKCKVHIHPECFYVFHVK